MITIEMGDTRGINSLYDKLLQSELKGMDVERDENRIIIRFRVMRESLPLLSSVLTEFVIATEEERILLNIIQSMFYFEDRDEQEQILTIVKSIIQGEKPDLPGLKQVLSRRQIIYHAFSGFLTDVTYFQYESFLRFRLKPYYQCLQRYVEMAIDEYKLEQEYQGIVENLRRLLKQRKPQLDMVHLVFNYEFALYDRQYRRIEEQEVRRSLDPVLRQRWGLDIEPSVLITLIGLAPETIFLYTDNVDAAMIQTIQNVFQERVVICPARACDFHSNG